MSGRDRNRTPFIYSQLDDSGNDDELDTDADNDSGGDDKDDGKDDDSDSDNGKEDAVFKQRVGLRRPPGISTDE